MEDNRNAKKVSILLLDMTFMICILQLNVKARRTLRFEESLRQEDLDQANRALDGVDLDEWDQRKKLLVDLGICCGDEMFMSLCEHEKIVKLFDLLENGKTRFRWHVRDGPFEHIMLINEFVRRRNVKELNLVECLKRQPMDKVRLVCDAINELELTGCVLSGNSFSPDALKIVLESCPRMEKLNLYFSARGDECGEMVIEYVEKNNNLKRLDVGNNDWSENVTERFLEVVSKHKRMNGIGLFWDISCQQDQWAFWLKC